MLGGSFISVKVMLFLMKVMRPPPLSRFRSFRTVEYPVSFGVLAVEVSLLSCMVMMSAFCSLARMASSSILLRIPLAFS